jgi:multidrug efflux pump subunit AcrA (membrane-fusion protein)
MLVLGLLPLLAAGIWLLLLRQPQPAAAYPSGPWIDAGASEQRAAALPRFTGVVVAGQDAELGAELAAEVVEVFAQPGARVARGDALLQLSALSVAGARNIALAQAAEDRSLAEAARITLQSARDELARMQSAPSAYALADVQATRNEVAKASAELARLRASAAVRRATVSRDVARADKQIVRAPFDGVLAARYVDNGDFVSAGQALARVVDDTRFVRFALPAAEHALLHVGDPIQAYAHGERPVDRQLSAAAAIVDVDPEIDAAAGLGFVRAAFSGEAALALRLAPGTRLAVAVPEPERQGGR